MKRFTKTSKAFILSLSVALGATLVVPAPIAVKPVSAETTTQVTKVITTGYPYFKKSLTNTETYGTIRKGTVLAVLDKPNNYYYKVSYNGHVGYVSVHYVDVYETQKIETPVQDQPATTTPTVTGHDEVVSVVTTGYPYFKKSLSNTDTYGTIRKGTVLDVLSVPNKYYYKVEYNGKIGYVSSRYVQVKETMFVEEQPDVDTGDTDTTPSSGTTENWEVVADKVIAEAKALEPLVQYGYGKNSPSTYEFDCSSFTKYVFNKVGVINLYWGARKQSTFGTKITNKADLRKGDLVFFSLPSTYDNRDEYYRIAHVGIYMGNGKFIHNLNATYDVNINDLTTGYWEKHYVTATRVIQ